MQVSGTPRTRMAWTVGALAASALAVATSPNWAQNFVRLQFHTFQDSRGVTVLSPFVDFDKDFTDRTGLEGEVRRGRHLRGVGFVRALPSAKARTTPAPFSNVNVRRKFGDFKVEFGGEVSREKFYAADTGMISASRDFNKSNTTVAGGYSFSFNRPQMHPSEEVAAPGARRTPTRR